MIEKLRKFYRLIFVDDREKLPEVPTRKMSIQEIDAEINRLTSIWNGTNDEGVIDYCIHQIKALQCLRAQLNKEVKIGA